MLAFQQFYQYLQLKMSQIMSGHFQNFQIQERQNPNI